MATTRTATPKPDNTSAAESEPEVASGRKREVASRRPDTSFALAALNPLRLARQIVPSRRTPVEHLAFYGTIVALAFAEVIEPPIATLIIVGHRLHSSRFEAVREVGEGLDQAG